MRTTLTLDDDVAALLEKVQRERDTTFRQVVNEALRQGLECLSGPKPPKAFRTQPADLGKCFFANLDNTWEVLAEAEGSHK
jgi:hypothetical protein